jgi:uncharacterized protein YndB with AHSA1/START domain
MLRVAGIITVVIVVVAAAVLIYAATRPGTFRVERSLAIKAAPDELFALVSDLHAWAVWSSYEKKDPAMKRSFSGAAAGKGAVYDWDGNKNVGAGRMEIIEAIPPSKIVLKLDFLKPFEGHNTAEFAMVPSGDSTTVTWAMHGPSAYLFKVMGIFFNMDRMIGDDFAVGLANLKAVAEK